MGSDIKTSPGRVFWASDAHTPENTQSCFFFVVVPGLQRAKAISAVTDLFAGKKKIKSVELTEAALDSVVIPVPALNARYYRFWFKEPTALNLDSVTVELRSRDEKGRITVPLERYVQKAHLIFPFKGQALIMQGWVNDNGHANSSGQFALDVLGLTDLYAPQLSNETENTAYAGWGRPLIAPGKGVVAAVRDGIPNQVKPETNDEKSYTLPDGTQVSQGNHVVIDHENGEYSAVMHMQPGSIVVKKGDRVEQGQPIGKLGNSGNTFGPHVHFQLQDGIDFATANGLPVEFENVKGPLTRGRYFNAK